MRKRAHQCVGGRRNEIITSIKINIRLLLKLCLYFKGLSQTSHPPRQTSGFKNLNNIPFLAVLAIQLIPPYTVDIYNVYFKQLVGKTFLCGQSTHISVEVI